jgi:hypothetical protein
MHSVSAQRRCAECVKASGDSGDSGRGGGWSALTAGWAKCAGSRWVSSIGETTLITPARSAGGRHGGRSWAPKRTRSIPRARPIRPTHLRAIDPAGLSWSHQNQGKKRSRRTTGLNPGNGISSSNSIISLILIRGGFRGAGKLKRKPPSRDRHEPCKGFRLTQLVSSSRRRLSYLTFTMRLESF